jgi:hypothetical protein
MIDVTRPREDVGMSLIFNTPYTWTAAVLALFVLSFHDFPVLVYSS